MSDQPAARPLVEEPTSRRSWFTTRRIVALCVGGGSTLMLAVWLIAMPKQARVEPPKPPHRATDVGYEAPKVLPTAASVPAPIPPQPTVAPFVPPPPPVFASTQVTKVEPPKRPAVYSFGSNGGALPEYLKPKREGSEPGKPQEASTSIAYKSAAIAGSKTATIPDRNLLLLPGPLLCIMDTTVNTDVAGPFQCHLDRDALSPTNVVLMEKGTKIQGGYVSGAMQGQTRVVAVTGFAITPNGVMVPLGGPIADELGAGGVDGSVDNHWMQRLGGALLLSLVDAGFQLAQTELQKAGSTNLNISNGGGVSTLASQLLQKTINIPPTITINQGTTVALWNTGIIDFGPSYKLEMAR